MNHSLNGKPKEPINITEEDLNYTDKIVEEVVKKLSTESQKIAFFRHKSIIPLIFECLNNDISKLVQNGTMVDRNIIFNALVKEIQQFLNIKKEGIILPGMPSLPSLDITTVNVVLGVFKELSENLPPVQMNFTTKPMEQNISSDDSSKPQIELGH